MSEVIFTSLIVRKSHRRLEKVKPRCDVDFAHVDNPSENIHAKRAETSAEELGSMSYYNLTGNTLKVKRPMIVDDS